MKKIILMLVPMLFMTTSIFPQWDIDEGFEGDTFPPTGWIVNNANGGDTWIKNINSSYSHTGSNSARMPGLFNPADDVKAGQDTPPLSVIYIPADYPTIQEGLNAANIGDTVLVSAGTYYENIEWPNTDGIVLISETGATNTMIDGSGQNRVIYNPQANSLTNATVIDGFTIQNGYYSGTGPHPGGGIADYCGITIRNNIIKDNFAGGVGGGIHLAVGTPLVFNNLILNNTSNDTGGGIFIFCEAEIRNNTIVGNTATGAGGGGIGIVFASGTQIIEDNIIVNNSADGSSEGGGGILIFYSTCSLDYNNVWGNTLDNYAGCSAGTNSISADPVFVVSNNQDYFLDQDISPCIDAGSQTAFDAGLNNYTTSSELILDSDQVDIGYHYNPDDFNQTNVYDDSVLAIETLLLPNYPNPFSQSTEIAYQLPVPGKVVLKIYDMNGKERRTLVNENQLAGKHSVVWNGKNNSGNAVEPGMYFYRFSLDNNFSQAKKMLILK